MVFSSFPFISIFLPAVWALSMLSGNIVWKNAVLLIASLLFYAYGEPVYIVLLIASVAASYFLAEKIENAEREASKKKLLFLSCVIHLGLLAVFKYAGFFTETVNTVFHLGIPIPQIKLPIGISFYTFQAMSYVIDVYRGTCRAQKNFLALLLYISFFPQLIAGPIVRYHDIEKELTDRRVTYEGTLSGMVRFSAGLGKKILIADICAKVADSVFEAPSAQVGTAAAWLGAAAYMLQIYFDFSGYSDMAIGLGRMFGFHFLENFDHPYIASSMRDFWTRWHISLSSWLREYLYYPLGGNRKGKARTVFNRLLVFALCGLWHGAGLTFLFWGIYHGILTAIEGAVPFFRKDRRHSLPGRIFMHLYTVLAVMIGFVFFRADSIREGFLMVGTMFTVHAAAGTGQAFLASLLTPENMVMMIIGALFCIPAAKLLRKPQKASETVRTADGQETADIAGKARQDSWRETVSAVLALIVLAVSVIHMSTGGYSPFIYFRF